MAKIPKEILEKKAPTRAQRISASRSPINPIPILGKTSINGRVVTFKDGTTKTFETRESAWAIFKRERKDNGETY